MTFGTLRANSVGVAFVETANAKNPEFNIMDDSFSLPLSLTLSTLHLFSLLPHQTIFFPKNPNLRRPIYNPIVSDGEAHEEEVDLLH